MAMARSPLAKAVAWSKYTPNEPPQDPFKAGSEAAGRRAWLLRWGWWVSQGMMVGGLLLIVYWLFFKG